MTQNSAPHVLRMSAPSAWDHPTPHSLLLPTTSSLLTDIAPHGISVNSCLFVAQKNTSRYAQIRGDFSVHSVDCFPLTSSDSDFQFRVKFLTRRRKGRRTICSFVLMSNILSHTEYTEWHRIFWHKNIFVSTLKGQKLRDTLRLSVRINNMSAVLCAVCVKYICAGILCLPCLLCEKNSHAKAQRAQSYLFFSSPV